MQRIGIIALVCLVSACSGARAQEQESEPKPEHRMFGVETSCSSPSE
jgi:hypothetical protein